MLCLFMASQLAFPIDTASGPRMPIYYTPCENGPVHVMSRSEKEFERKRIAKMKMEGKG